MLASTGIGSTLTLDDAARGASLPTPDESTLVALLANDPDYMGVWGMSPWAGEVDRIRSFSTPSAILMTMADEEHTFMCIVLKCCSCVSGHACDAEVVVFDPLGNMLKASEFQSRSSTSAFYVHFSSTASTCAFLSVRDYVSRRLARRPGIAPFLRSTDGPVDRILSQLSAEVNIYDIEPVAPLATATTAGACGGAGAAEGSSIGTAPPHGYRRGTSYLLAAKYQPPTVATDGGAADARSSAVTTATDCTMTSNSTDFGGRAVNAAGGSSINSAMAVDTDEGSAAKVDAAGGSLNSAMAVGTDEGAAAKALGESAGGSYSGIAVLPGGPVEPTANPYAALPVCTDDNCESCPPAPDWFNLFRPSSPGVGAKKKAADSPEGKPPLRGAAAAPVKKRVTVDDEARHDDFGDGDFVGKSLFAGSGSGNSAQPATPALEPAIASAPAQNTLGGSWIVRCTATDPATGEHPRRVEGYDIAAKPKGGRPPKAKRRGKGTKGGRPPKGDNSTTYHKTCSLSRPGWTTSTSILRDRTPRDAAIFECGLAVDATEICRACEQWFVARHAGLADFLARARAGRQPTSTDDSVASAEAEVKQASILRPVVVVSEAERARAAEATAREAATREAAMKSLASAAEAARDSMEVERDAAHAHTKQSDLRADDAERRVLDANALAAEATAREAASARAHAEETHQLKQQHKAAMQELTRDHDSIVANLHARLSDLETQHAQLSEWAILPRNAALNRAQAENARLREEALIRGKRIKDLERTLTELRRERLSLQFSVSQYQGQRRARQAAREKGWHRDLRRDGDSPPAATVDSGYKQRLDRSARAIVEEIMFQASGEEMEGAEILAAVLKHDKLAGIVGDQRPDSALKDRVLQRLKQSLFALKYQTMHEHQSMAYQIILRSIAPPKAAVGSHSGDALAYERLLDIDRKLLAKHCEWRSLFEMDPTNTSRRWFNERKQRCDEFTSAYPQLYRDYLEWWASSGVTQQSPELKHVKLKHRFGLKFHKSPNKCSSCDASCQVDCDKHCHKHAGW